jgi:hypothetical protein
MFPTRSRTVHTEIIQLRATAAQVKEFIMTPERILDYYPSGIDCGVIEPGMSLYCRGKSGVSLLELDVAESNDKKLVVNVTTAMNLSPPFTAERIKDAVFFTMVEDWKVEPHDSGTQLTKTWRDIKKFKLRFLPMRSIVKKSARAESASLKNSWDATAQALENNV